MSIWHEIKPEDMELDGDEINIHIGSDYSGNVYAIVRVKDIQVLLTNSQE